VQTKHLKCYHFVPCSTKPLYWHSKNRDEPWDFRCLSGFSNEHHSAVLKIFLSKNMPWINTGEWKYSFTYSSTSALLGSEWSASCPDCLTPRDKKMTLCVEKKLSGLQSQSQHMELKKSLATARNWTNISQQSSSQTNHFIDGAIPASQFPDSLFNLRGTS